MGQFDSATTKCANRSFEASGSRLSSRYTFFWQQNQLHSTVRLPSQIHIASIPPNNFSSSQRQFFSCGVISPEAAGASESERIRGCESHASTAPCQSQPRTRTACTADAARAGRRPVPGRPDWQGTGPSRGCGPAGRWAGRAGTG
jgi:hypothetical protein